MNQIYSSILRSIEKGRPMLAILVDPDKFDCHSAQGFLDRLPDETTHILVGGSTVEDGDTERAVTAIKSATDLPVLLFPGHHNQLTSKADGLLFLSLLSGRNPEFLVGQQVKAAALLNGTSLEVIPTSYLLIDGGHRSAVERVTNTKPMSQDDIPLIAHTARAGELMGARLCYLEAGSGAKDPVSPPVIEAVRKSIRIPLIVGGGIRSASQLEAAYKAGADLVVMGTHFEKNR
jgi:putative glycerol-1-phosphate prenyltransferase